jgi:hypothetical protein
MPASVAAMEGEYEAWKITENGAPALGDPNYKHDDKYAPIYGSMDGRTFFLHYCLPGFVPQGLGECDLGSIPGRDPRGVQVEYNNALGSREAERVGMEASAAYKLPFPVNVNIEDKTPYFNRYKKAFEQAKWKSHQVVKGVGALQDKYEGLDFYESPGLPGGWWVPEDLTEYRTKLGNPPIFECSTNYCYLILDQGNGWVVTARFNEAALSGWRAFFVQLNESINIVME